MPKEIKDLAIRNSTAEFLIFTSQSGEKSIEVKCKYSIQHMAGGWKATTGIRNICILRNPTERALASEQSPNL